MLVADYSAARPGGARLRAAGFIGAVRYASLGRTDVNLSRGEANDLRSHGLQVGIVNEHEADYTMHRSGHDCALQARDIALGCGLPDGLTFFAVDFDCTLGGPTSPGSPGDRNMTRIAKFFDDAAAAIGQGNVGWYGSYFGAMWMRQHLGWKMRAEWATEAWSQGLVLPGCLLYQYAAGSSVSGVDKDSTIYGWWGQRDGLPGPGPAPGPGLDPHRFDVLLLMPTLSEGSADVPRVKTLQQCLNRAVVPGYTPLAVDGSFGPHTLLALRQYQFNRRLTVDGIAGPHTWGDFRFLFLNRGYTGL